MLNRCELLRSGRSALRGIAGLKDAANAQVGIAVLSELAMSAQLAEEISADLMKVGKVIPKDAAVQTMRVVVTGSFHHVDEDGNQRNSTEIQFPRAEPAGSRRHSKSGDFFI